MSGRAARLGRVLAVQEARRKLEEWRLVDLGRQAAALDAATIDLLRSLGDESLLHGLFLDAKAAALRRVDAERAVVEAERDRTRVRLRDAHGIEKRLERAVAQAAGAERATAERQDLARTLDDFLSNRAAADAGASASFE